MYLTNTTVNNNADMIQTLIRIRQSLETKYNANNLVHYLFVPGRNNSKEEQELLKTHILFYGTHDCYGLNSFYKSISRQFNKPSQKFLAQKIFNTAQPLNNLSN